MATNHHAMIRYQTIDRCLRNKYRKYFIDDLVKECCDAIYNYCGIKDGVKTRQLWKDISYMESPEGWNAPIEHVPEGFRKYLRYSDPDFSINKRPMSEEEAEKLRETLYMLSRFKGMPQFEWIEELITSLQFKFNLSGPSENIISFDQNSDYSGTKHINDLFELIVKKMPIRLQYRKFNGDEFTWILHPYFIRQYNKRWFLFGYNEQVGDISNVPLDRILGFKPLPEVPYRESKINCEEFFENIVGVTGANKPKSAVEKVVLRFSPERFPYILSKPIHQTMKVLDQENCVVQIEVIPNKELEALIFSYGDQAEVLEPQWLRNQIIQKYLHVCDIYKVLKDKEN